MRRRIPNLWVLIPSLLGGVIGGVLGWVVTDVSCRDPLLTPPLHRCPVWAGTMGVVGFLIGLLGMGTVVVLVYRSIAEARQAHERGEEPPGPGCEV